MGGAKNADDETIGDHRQHGVQAERLHTSCCPSDPGDVCEVWPLTVLLEG